MTTPPASPRAAPPMPPGAAAAGGADSIENRYYAYLRGKGYSSTEALLAVLRVYLPLFEGLESVADLGCGHGEFLAQLREHGHAVAGVDVDPGMVEACRAQGFDVALGDAAHWLAGRPASLDGVFSSNVIEHLPAADVTRWIAAAYAALRPGGRLVLATPNPESVVVQLYEFWRDPTHVRLYSRQLLEFMLVDAGFAAVSSHENPAAIWEGTPELLDGMDAPLSTAIAPPAQMEPLPTPPPADAPLRQRLAWKLSSFVYNKLTQPFVAPLRADVERQLAALQQQAAALDDLNGRIHRLAAADRLLHPSREIYVVGTKPSAPVA